ncbi:MAG: ParB N-terminal domain-containing protein [Fuerstiella sp.]|nr:ParB N-terminal domain-containing protein [Fuerstiella sp.]
MTTKALSIDLLRIDADTQARVKINEDVVDDYAGVLENNSSKKWPLGELDVFHDGTDYFVADGFHRTLAAQRVKRASIPCRIHKGTAKDARVFGMTANDQHGLRMSRADKRSCVEWLLDNGGKMKQAEIAEKAGVDLRTVSRVVADRKSENTPLSCSNTQAADDRKGSEATKPQSGESAQDGSSTQPPRHSDEKLDQLAEHTRTSDTERIDLDDGPGENEPIPPKKEEWRIARSKAKKTTEALMRALCDLHDLKPISFRDQSLEDCETIIGELDVMK